MEALEKKRDDHASIDNIPPTTQAAQSQASGGDQSAPSPKPEQHFFPLPTNNNPIGTGEEEAKTEQPTLKTT